MKFITRKLSEPGLEPLARRAYGLSSDDAPAAAVDALAGANPFAAADLAATAVGTVLIVPEAPPLTTGPDARPPSRLAPDAVLAARRALQEVRDERQAVADRRAAAAADTLNFINGGGINQRPPNFASPNYLEFLRTIFTGRAADTENVRQASNFGFPILRTELNKLLGALGETVVEPLRVRRFTLSGAPGPRTNDELRLEVPAGFEILGGGARYRVVNQGLRGQGLTASFPDGPRAWVARTRTFNDPVNGSIEISVLALHDPDDRYEVRITTEKTSVPASQGPAAAVAVAAAAVDAGFTRTGGGAEHRGGSGSLLTASLPTDTGWTATAVDLSSVPGTLEVSTSVIGLRARRGPTPAATLVEVTTEHASRGSLNVAAPPGTILVGGGARIDLLQGTPSLISASTPGDGDGWFASHDEALGDSIATITVAAIGVADALVVFE